jgi:hypothetical protein
MNETKQIKRLIKSKQSQIDSLRQEIAVLEKQITDADWREKHVIDMTPCEIKQRLEEIPPSAVAVRNNYEFWLGGWSNFDKCPFHSCAIHPKKSFADLPLTVCSSENKRRGL